MAFPYPMPSFSSILYSFFCRHLVTITHSATIATPTSNTMATPPAAPPIITPMWEEPGVLVIPSVITGVEGVEVGLSLIFVIPFVVTRVGEMEVGSSLVLVIPFVVTGVEEVEAGLSLVLMIPSVEGAESGELGVTSTSRGGGVTCTSGGGGVTSRGRSY